MIVKRLLTLCGVFLILLFALLSTRASNKASAASNIYVRVTVVPNDIDHDGYSNDEEIAAGSNPADPDSTPGTTQLNLYTGVNFISLRADVLSMGNAVTLLESLGGSQVIQRVLIFDPGSQSFIEAGYNEAGEFYGENYAFTAGQGNLGLVIYSKEDTVVVFTSVYSPAWNLKQGINLVGIPNTVTGLTASNLLDRIGGEVVVNSMSGYNEETGRFETMAYYNGQLVGVDFRIVPGEGYFIFMKNEVLGFRP